jgi:Tripartite tricarboxylate transporter TctB family
MTGGITIPIVLIVVMGITMGIASTYPYLQAKIVPMLVAGIIMLLATVELIKELRSRAAPITPKEEGQTQGNEETDLRGSLVQGAWMVGFLLTIYLVGFPVSIALFTAIYAWAHKTRWPTAIGLGVFMAVLSYVLFSYLVEAELYPGIIVRGLGLAG